MVSQVIGATHALGPGTPDEEVLRAACRAFLAFVAGEPEFAKIFYVDMPAAGPRAWERLDTAQHKYAVLNQTWHERARERHPEWPAVPYEAYLALAGRRPRPGGHHRLAAPGGHGRPPVGSAPVTRAR